LQDEAEQPIHTIHAAMLRRVWRGRKAELSRPRVI
jgi:hypothetical protein